MRPSPPCYTLSVPDVAAALLMNEPKFQKFTQQIDKCLASFDNAQDWADCTAFLTRLLKVDSANTVSSVCFTNPLLIKILVTHTQFKEIPRKLVISKRLGQCLNPALPTGVHQRALDIYVHIFSTYGVRSW
jgi:hypothetical protein